jgi:hypothetical protein
VLPRIYDNVMKVTDNRPLPDKQPFHRDLDIEVWMSEPDFGSASTRSWCRRSKRCTRICIS